MNDDLVKYISTTASSRLRNAIDEDIDNVFISGDGRPEKPKATVYFMSNYRSKTTETKADK